MTTYTEMATGTSMGTDAYAATCTHTLVDTCVDTSAETDAITAESAGVTSAAGGAQDPAEEWLMRPRIVQLTGENEQRIDRDTKKHGLECRWLPDVTKPLRVSVSLSTLKKSRKTGPRCVVPLPRSELGRNLTTFYLGGLFEIPLTARTGGGCAATAIGPRATSSRAGWCRHGGGGGGRYVNRCRYFRAARRCNNFGLWFWIELSGAHLDGVSPTRPCSLWLVYRAHLDSPHLRIGLCARGTSSRRETWKGSHQIGALSRWSRASSGCSRRNWKRHDAVGRGRLVGPTAVGTRR